MKYLLPFSKTALHTACDSGKKVEVLRLLEEIQQNGSLENELLSRDDTGRTALCLAQAEKHRDWNERTEKWEDMETDAEYEARQETATAMLEWIQSNASDVLDEVKKR